MLNHPYTVEALYQQHGPEVLSYLGRHCPEAVAHDLLHDIFLQVVRHPQRLKSVVTPRAWLFGLARHILASHYRQHAVSERAVDSVQARVGESPEDPRLAEMRIAISRLSLDLRETLELRLEENLSYEEIAHTLGIPIGTVRSRLHHAVRRLRAVLTKTEKNP
jgi:RNA polymerase sigma-70 factor, ECF subfamily